MSLTRRHLLGFATTALVASRLPSWAAAPPADGPLGTKAVEALLKQRKVPGASLAIIDGGAVVAAYAYGLAQAGTNRKVEDATQFQAASLSKTINALLILKLVKDGKLKLGDPVNDHLKSWKLGGTNAGKVTIKALLSHTGGTTVSGFDGYDPARPIPTLLQVLDGKPPANSPAVKASNKFGVFAYSGGGITVLQQMVIDVTGEEYPTAAKRLVFDPLGMSNSNYRQPPAADANVAHAHDKDGKPIRGGFNVYPELAAAGLWTTPTDMAQAVIAILNANAGASGAFLTPALAGEMLTKVHTDAGLGVFINGRGRFYHNGVNRGFRDVLVGDPRKEKNRNGLVVLTNGENGETVYADLQKSVVAEYAWS